jgi:succinoglycan biosynthesis protein ExoM
MLERLLEKLQHQKNDQLFTYSIVVVDNDFNQSAKAVSESFKSRSNIDIDYYVEPEQNIAMARNKAVENSRGDFIAFIDDDEFPCNEWLSRLYEACHKWNADGVLAPVLPYFEAEPPTWVVKGRLCERESFETGFPMREARNTRTGNVLLKRNLFNEVNAPFDPGFGRTGGEDVDFFGRMIREKRLFVWCNEAPAYESVPPQRLKRTYFLRRALLRGVANSKGLSVLDFGVFKSIIAFGLYTPALPVLLLLRHDLFMKYLIKDCDHIGKLLALCGLKVIKERSF